jgi:hypothetical protein
MRLNHWTLAAALAIFSPSTFAGQDEPEFSLSFRNGSDLTELLRKNPWLERLRKTNLYDGLTLRFQSVLGALPSEKQSYWKGRLADTLVELALKNRTVSIDYYRASGMIQPIGFSAKSENAVEMKALATLMESLRVAKDQDIDDGIKSQSVTPIEISAQRFAVRLAENCLSISRDPFVAVWSWRKCRAGKLPAKDVELAVNIPSFAGASEKALQGFLGMEPIARVFLEKTDKHSLAISGASIPLKTGHILKNASLSAEVLAALPASTHFLVTMAVPLPENLDPAELKTFLAKDTAVWGQAKRANVSFFHLGSTRVPGSGFQADTGLLVEASVNGGETALARLFEPRHGKEVFVKDVCKKRFTLVTPSQAVLDAVTAACEGRVPSLAQAPAAMKALLAMESGVQAVLVNFGQSLARMIDLGWDFENQEKSKPAEVEEARKILADLPTVVFGGKVEKMLISFESKSWWNF